MKTAVILSDTHGNKNDLLKIKDILKEADYIFHLGDGFYDLYVFDTEITKKIVQVVGNCDLVDYDRERTVEIEGVKIYMTHGHLYGAKSGTAKLAARAEEVGADLCLYGHTHQAKIETFGSVTVANPGTLYRYSDKKSFIYAVFNEGKVTLKINENTLL